LSFLTPLPALASIFWISPTACAVGYILLPLRGWSSGNAEPKAFVATMPMFNWGQQDHVKLRAGLGDEPKVRSTG